MEYGQPNTMINICKFVNKEEQNQKIENEKF